MELIITNPSRLLSAPVHLKKCTHPDCLQWKPYSQFRKHAGYADGYKSWCNECARLYQIEWYRKKKALNPKYPRCIWIPPKPEHSNTCRWKPPIECMPFPEAVFLPDSIQQAIRRQLADKKRRDEQRSPSIIKILSFKDFIELKSISRPRRYIPCEKHLYVGGNKGEYFLEHRIRPEYITTVLDEYIAKDEYCYGEPHSSYKDFIKDAGETKYLMTLDEDGNYLHERVMVEENPSELSFLPKSRPELLRVA